MKKNRDNPSWAYGLLFLVATFIGCIQPSKYHGRVVERSKATPPIWVDLTAGVFHERDQRLAFVGVKEHIYDLPLGIKQAQYLATNQSLNLLHRKVRQTIDEIAKESGIDLLSSKAVLDKELMSVLRQEHKSSLKIVDIYYEKYQTPGAKSSETIEEATVYVLSYFPLGGVSRILEQLATNFAKNPAKELNKLSVVLLKSLQ
jgi:hypothetical protein